MLRKIFLLFVAISSAPPVRAENEAWKPLLGAYLRRPPISGGQDLDGYPSGRDYSWPDAAVPYRWHFYHEGAIEPFARARMLPHVEPFNSLEGGGVRADKDSGVTLSWVAEHATLGKKSLRAVFSPPQIESGKALIHLDGVEGGPSFSSYLKARGMMNTASCYRPHFRWIKLDVFNPASLEVNVRVSGTPLILHPGANVVAVKMPDSVARGYECCARSFPLQVTAPAREVVLYLDHVRMEQEVPEVLSRQGKLLQFPGRADAMDPLVLWPGFTAVDSDTLYTPERKVGWTQPATKRRNSGHSFRSMENGLCWGWCSPIDSPLRIDVPPGRYGVFLFGAPLPPSPWAQGLTMKINGKQHRLLAPRPEAAVRKMALSGETWDYRPGSCVWEALVRPVYYPPLEIPYEEAREGNLLVELPANLALHFLAVFPESEKEEALRELGRLNYLMAESWDVSHPEVRASYAVKTGDGKPYLGVHEELVHPERIPEKLRALSLEEDDFRRGYLLFQRGLTEHVYPDSIPIPQEARPRELRCLAAPGQRECLTLGFLPLREVRGLKVKVSDLSSKLKNKLPGNLIDVRVSRQHQKCMQFGHHNHDYAYMEQYLVRRPLFDLYPGAARRLYLDLHLPSQTPPGEYLGLLTIESADGKKLSELPLAVEVVPLNLKDPPVFFAGSLADPRLKDYGFNTFATSYDDAVKQGYKGYLANLGHGQVSFKAKKIGWSSFLKEAAILEPIIGEGQKGKGPRGFFGGPAPGTHSNPMAQQIAQEFFTRIRKTYPTIDLLGRTMPAFYLGGPTLQFPHEWIYLAGPPRKASKEALEAARTNGEPFWFIDGLRHAKEQAGRFTFGVWLWRLGAQGRYTTLEATLQYGNGTARPTFSWHPYFTLLDVTTCNIDRALMPSLDEDTVNPSRDLILLRAGIDDYRYLFTLEQMVLRAEKNQAGGAAVKAAKKFLQELAEDVSLDLLHYYQARAGAYGENWFPRPDNPWTSERFGQVRRQAALIMLALQDGLKDL